MTNVIQFPKGKNGAPPQNLDEIQSEIELTRQIHIGETLSGIAEILLQSLDLNGFIVGDDEKYAKDLALTVEAIRSVLYKYYGMEYPFQTLSDKIFTLEKDGFITFSSDAISKITIDKEN
jgi:hypothetical protein